LKTRPSPTKKIRGRAVPVALTMCVHNESELLATHLKYHRFLGASKAYIYLDRCTDASAEIARSLGDWVEIIERNSPIEKHFFRTHQTACMNDALERARSDNCDWLLAIDPDEFVVPEDGEQPQIGEGNPLSDASFRNIVNGVSDEVYQIVFSTWESFPIRRDEYSAFWRNPFFIKRPFSRQLFDPISRQYRTRASGFFGHNLGKALIRTSADVQAYNAHQWTIRQSVRANEFPKKVSVPTINRGFHCHFLVISPSQWLKKYRSFANHFTTWPSGLKVGFPKMEWTKMSLEYPLPEIYAYLNNYVFESIERARQFVDAGCLVKDTRLRSLIELACPEKAGINSGDFDNL
jgi:Glycosyl transferase family 2